MSSDSCSINEFDLKNTGFGYTLSVINGKYKMTILYCLAECLPTMRYGELKRCIKTISHKTLSTTLKELESDDLIIRQEYPQIPPKVEYRLSDRGTSLIPVLNMMCFWGESHRQI